VFVGDEELEGVKKMTSYDPLALQSLLSLALKAGCTHAVLEVSSHGLHQKRFAHIPFHVGVLTNITPEHLDYHGTLERYAREKKKLFQSVQRIRGK
jgi:UDP-N-acetylmuramoyl-L-alanyl-D-glutamate--2,6-diaminopimelate ligase